MIEKSLLQVYTDLHPRLSPKYTIRGNVLSLSVEGGPCRRWRDAGQHTCLHAHTHAYTSHTQSHTTAASLWWVLAHRGVPGGSWPVLGLRWAAGPASLWGDTAAPGSAGAGQWSWRAGQETPQAAGKALFSALDLCPWTACLARPSAECTWGRRMTSNDFGLLEETFGLWPGRVDFTQGSKICTGDGVIQEARKATPLGRQHLTLALSMRQESEGSGNVHPSR